MDTERQPLPIIPDGWNTIKEPREGLLGEKTFSYFNYPEVSSALQKSIRRCQWPEAAQWGLEAFRTGIKCRTNILRRLFIYASEDIGPAKPSLILLLDDILSVDNPAEYYNTEEVFLLALQILTKSPKSRLLDWMCHSTMRSSIETNDIYNTAEMLMFHIEDALKEKDMDRAVKYTSIFTTFAEQYSVHTITKAHFEKWRGKFGVPKIGRHYTKMSTVFWLPVLGVAYALTESLNTCILVCRLYNIACTRSKKFEFRYKEGNDLFKMHAIWALCHPKEVEATWVFDQKHSLISELDGHEALKAISERYMRREGLFGIPDYALDKHTHEGIRKGRGFEHFILEGSKLNHMVPSVLEDERRHLLKVIEIWKQLNLLRNDFCISKERMF
jgi:hypothetical protein